MLAASFYRKFTKINSYTGVTALGKIHTHLFILGMIIFRIVAFYAKQYKLEDQKSFHMFLIFYNIGLIVASVVLVTCGIPQITGAVLSSSVSSMISGIAGLGHISFSVGMILLIISFKKKLRNN